MGLATWGGVGLLLICGFPVGVAVYGALEDVRGRRDLGLGGLQDGVLSWSGPGGEGRAEVAVVWVFGGDPLALAVREPGGEGAVRGGQVFDPLADVGGRLLRRQGELVALSLGGGLGS